MAKVEIRVIAEVGIGVADYISSPILNPSYQVHFIF